MRNFSIFFAFLLSLSACSATGPKFQDTPFAMQQVPEHKARIIFFREFDVNFRSVILGIDGSRVGALAHQGFIVADTAPGDRRISAWVRYLPLGEFAIGMNLKAGETYYIRVSHRDQRMAYPLFGPLGTALLLVDSKGEFQLEPLVAVAPPQELQELKLSE
ncbi:MAG: hypothetical protein ACREQ2_00160 [Candidatus Binatia bacterium]